MELFSLWIQAILLNITFMMSVWLYSVATKNSGIIDIAWALSFALTGNFYFYQIESPNFYSYLAFITYNFWSFRLGLYLLVRFVGMPEDSRYTVIKDEKNGSDFKMWTVFLFQGSLAGVLSFPLLLQTQIAHNNGPTGFFIIGLIIMLLGVLGENISDLQLYEFKNNSSNKNKVCKVGVWNYSRHPNYFFEFMIWVGLAVSCLCLPYGYLAILAPAAMFYFLYKFTGVAHNDNHMKKFSKREGLEEYMNSTSSFFPLNPK